MLSPENKALVERYAPWTLAGNDSDYQDLEALLNAARAQGQTEEGWRPIETAPRDGSPILIWDPSQSSHETMPHYDDSSRVVRFDDRRYAIGYWRTFYGERHIAAWGKPWGNRNSDHPKPTHWMPLPHPPKASASCEGGRDADHG